LTLQSPQKQKRLFQKQRTTLRRDCHARSSNPLRRQLHYHCHLPEGRDRPSYRNMTSKNHSHGSNGGLASSINAMQICLDRDGREIAIALSGSRSAGSSCDRQRQRVQLRHSQVAAPATGPCRKSLQESSLQRRTSSFDSRRLHFP
jgi:hypothetical protein